jgi:tetratricopeptide (TPR) repeat protein
MKTLIYIKLLLLMRLHSFRFLFLLAFCIACTVTLGTAGSLAEGNLQSLLLQGRTLSENGQYREAIRVFQRAVQLDPGSENAHLSLGNSFFEIGSFKAASHAFRQVLKINPSNSTALFYLGLSLIQQKEYAEAIPHFEKAGALDPDFKQLSLFYIGEAQSELGQIQEASDTWKRAVKVNPTTDIARKTGTLVKKLTQGESKKPWSMSLSAGVEYDDNVTVSLQDLATGLDDFAYILEFSGAYKVLEASKFELEAGYDFYQTIYDDLSEFNLQSHIFSLGGGYKFKKFDVDVFTRYNRSTLGGEDFMETYSVAPQIGFFPTENWFTLIGYSYDDMQFFNDPARDAENQGIGMDHFVFFMKGKSYLLISYRFENKRTKGDEFTYAGHYGTLGVKTPLPFWNQKGTFNVTYRYFYKDYKDITPSLGAERRDFRHSIQVGLTQPIYKRLKLNLNYQFIDSVSNLRQIDFTENIASLTLSLSF